MQSTVVRKIGLPDLMLKLFDYNVDNSLKRMCWVQQSNMVRNLLSFRVLTSEICWVWPEAPGGQKFWLRPRLVLRNWFIGSIVFFGMNEFTSLFYNKSHFHSCPKSWGFTPSLAHSLKNIYRAYTFVADTALYTWDLIMNKIGIIPTFAEQTNTY